MRIGKRFTKKCEHMSTIFGEIPIATQIGYLGVIIPSALNFRLCLDNNRNKFYRNLNSLLGKIGTQSSIGVSLSLIAAQCTPRLTYGLESVRLTKSECLGLHIPSRDRL